MIIIFIKAYQFHVGIDLMILFTGSTDISCALIPINTDLSYFCFCSSCGSYFNRCLDAGWKILVFVVFIVLINGLRRIELLKGHN